MWRLYIASDALSAPAVVSISAPVPASAVVSVSVDTVPVFMVVSVPVTASVPASVFLSSCLSLWSAILTQETVFPHGARMVH